MSIQKFNRINGRTYKNWGWPSGLPDFSRYNLIYGWNGSGKTTLSDILRMIEKRQSIGEDGISEFSFVCEGRTITNGTIAEDQNPPQVRVFNKTFIDKNIFNDGAITPIYFIGEENIQKQELLSKKRGAQKDAQVAASNLESQKKQKEKELEQLCQGKASEIRGWLVITSQNAYHKGHFAKDCDDLLTVGDAVSQIKTEEELAALKTTVSSSVKKPIDSDSISFHVPDLKKETNEVQTLLQKTVVSKTIEALTQDQKLAGWVEEGLEIHKNHHADTCQFCTQKLPAGRLKDLEDHFNQEYKALDTAIKEKIAYINTAINSLKAVTKPNEAQLYDDLVSNYQSKCAVLDQQIEGCITALSVLLSAVENKKSSPFAAVPLEVQIYYYDSSALDAVNAIIAQHNSRTGNFNQSIDVAKSTVKKAIAAACIENYSALKSAVNELEKHYKALADSIQQVDIEIINLEKEIIDHKKPAEDINLDLRNYLGHGELQFSTVDNEAGYYITRNGQPAHALSEGEKTAIALLHFLKSLQDQNFDLTSGIVVIDDPVCSLDDTALFYVFGYIKERTKTAKQLFILTHNFSFFRQAKNWLKYEKDNNQIFQTVCNVENGQRVSRLKIIDALLRDYESEYHYLFKLVHDETLKPAGNDLAAYYPLPNIARRLLESFLAFRKPGTQNLHKKLESLNFDVAKKTRMRRFIETNSHDDQITAAEHDNTILSETPQILLDLMALIKDEDDRHYEEMIKLMPSLKQQDQSLERGTAA